MRCVGPISGMTSSGPTLAADGTPFVNINPAANREGSAVPSEVFNILLRELTHLVEFAAIVPSADDSDLQQVRKAVLKLIATTAAPVATTLVPGISRQSTIPEAESGTSTTPDAKPHVTPEGVAAAVSAARWKSRAIGEPFVLWDHLPGAEIPPTAVGGPRFIKLSAADAYNTGLLSGETVSGTAPDITATAVIALAGGPLYGQTIHLINTERRFLRGGASGDIEADAIRNIKSGDFEMQSALANVGGPIVNTSSPTQNWVLTSDRALLRSVRFDASAAVPTAAENRPRNISGTYYMRIF